MVRRTEHALPFNEGPSVVAGDVNTVEGGITVAWVTPE
jgi:hypothetical protein